MTSRILPADEWARLTGTELETVYPHLSPSRADVLVIEEHGQIVACWALLKVYHVEGVWIAPEHRKRGSVALRLLEGMRRLCRSLGVSQVVTSALSEDVQRLIVHLRGVRLPGDHYVIPMEGR